MAGGTPTPPGEEIAGRCAAADYEVMSPLEIQTTRAGWRWLALSGVAAIVFFLPTAMMGAAHALSAINASSTGAVKQAKRHHHWAQAWCWASAVVGIAVAIRIGHVL